MTLDRHARFAELEPRLRAPFQHMPVDWAHPRDVARIGLPLLDLLRDLHQLNEDSARVFYAASILHDLGWVVGQQQHHKRSMEMILAAEFEGIDVAEKRRIACLARYHRRAFPDPGHAIYEELPADEQETIRQLAAILRVADGLDRGQVGNVEYVSLGTLTGEIVHLVIHSAYPCNEELYGGRKKSDLFRLVFGRALVFSRSSLPLCEAAPDMPSGE